MSGSTFTLSSIAVFNYFCLELTPGLLFQAPFSLPLVNHKSIFSLQLSSGQYLGYQPTQDSIWLVVEKSSMKCVFNVEEGELVVCSIQRKQLLLLEIRAVHKYCSNNIELVIQSFQFG